nr:hypothetical protein Iba_chr06bCG10200 [Ipomoea batatas]
MAKCPRSNNCLYSLQPNHQALTYQDQQDQSQARRLSTNWMFLTQHIYPFFVNQDQYLPHLPQHLPQGSFLKSPRCCRLSMEAVC